MTLMPHRRLNVNHGLALAAYYQLSIVRTYILQVTCTRYGRALLDALEFIQSFIRKELLGLCAGGECAAVNVQMS